MLYNQQLDSNLILELLLFTIYIIRSVLPLIFKKNTLLVGANGAKGENGIPGSPGQKGEPGIGFQGLTGDKGDRAIFGAKGDMGKQ